MALSYLKISDLALAIAANAGLNAASDPQTDFTSVGVTAGAARRGPPDVNWTVRSAEWTPAEQDESVLSKACYQRTLVAEVAFLASDYDACNKLVKDWGAALFRTQTANSARVTGESHSPVTVAGLARYQIMLAVAFDDPVFYETYSVADVDATEQTGTLTE